MISFCLAGPAGEPISLAQVKLALRVDGEDEDGFLETLIKAARQHVESVAGLALLEQSWRVVLDAWPVERSVRLPRRPASEVLAITLHDDDGEAHAQGLSGVRVEPDRLILPAERPDLLLQAFGGVEIDYRAGFGAAEDVPADLVQAMLGLIGHWYEHRDAVVAAGAGAVVPSGFDRLLQPYRTVRL
jgi:uncharacterized phiE125 gp8 family phage protein